VKRAMHTSRQSDARDPRRHTTAHASCARRATNPSRRSIAGGSIGTSFASASMRAWPASHATPERRMLAPVSALYKNLNSTITIATILSRWIGDERRDHTVVLVSACMPRHARSARRSAPKHLLRRISTPPNTTSSPADLPNRVDCAQCAAPNAIVLLTANAAGGKARVHCAQLLTQLDVLSDPTSWGRLNSLLFLTNFAL
jgi:hypothetical protein